MFFISPPWGMDVQGAQCWQWVQLLPWEIFLAGGMVLGQVWIDKLRNSFSLVDFSGCCCELRPGRGAKSVLSQRVSRREKGRLGDSHLHESQDGSCTAASMALAQHLSHIALSEHCIIIFFLMLRSQDTVYIIVILTTPFNSSKLVIPEPALREICVRLEQFFKQQNF